MTRLRMLLSSILCLLVLTQRAEAAVTLESLHAGFDLVSFNETSGKELDILARQIQTFISNRSNAALLKTSSGQELLRKQTKLANYLAIRGAFEKCSQGGKRELAVRILDAAGRAQLVEVPCRSDLPGFQSLDVFFTATLERVNAPLRADLQKQIFQRSLANAANTYMDLKYRYGSGTPDPKAVLEICAAGRGRSPCDDESRAILVDSATRYLKELQSKSPARFSAAQASLDINRRIDEINSGLTQISVAASRGWFSKWVWDRSSPDFNDKAKEEVQKKYVEKYLQAASEGPGLLLLTPRMREAVGGLRTEEDLEKVNDRVAGKKFIFAPHKKIAPTDVQAAITEAQSAIREQSVNLMQMNTGRALEQNLNRMIAVNPVAAGQVLINHPELAPLVCNQINEISQTDEKDAKWKNAYLWGGAIVGGALLLTGVGSAAGAWLLAGTASAASLATVGTVATVAGLAVGLTDGGYHSIKALEARSAQAELETAFISGNSDPKAITEARQALSEFNEAKMSAMLSFGFSALDVASLSAVLKAGQRGAQLAKGSASGSSSAESIQGTTSLLRKLTNDPVYADLIAKVKTRMGGEKVAQFIAYLGQMSESVRLKILEKMSSWSPDRFRKVIDDALVMAQGCGK